MRRPAKPEDAEVAKPRLRKNESSRISELEKRLGEAIEQQTATAEVLKVISTSPTDVQPVFEAIAQRAATLSAAKFSYVTTFDGEWIHLRATHGPGTEEHHAFYPIRPGSSAVSARVTRDCAPVQIPDVLADAAYTQKEAARMQGFRSAVGVPMLRDGKVVGAIAVARPERGFVPDNLVRLLQTFADQAAIAIENVRLFKETKEALAQQTATSQILRVISESPKDASPVFETIVHSAVTLCGGLFAVVLRYDGERLHYVASHNTGPSYVELLKSKYPRIPDPSQVSGRVVIAGSAVGLEDVRVDPEYDQQFPDALGWRRMLGVPLMRDGKPVGVISVGWAEPGPIAKGHEQLLRTFADQAVIAIDNVRLFNETKDALERQTATSEILRVISCSPTDVQPVFDAIAAATLKLCRATLANVFRYDGELIHLMAVSNANVDPEYFAAIHGAFPRSPGLDSAAGRAVLTRNIVAIADVSKDPDYAIGMVTLGGGFRSVLAAPLVRGQHAIGALVVCRAQAGAFPESQVALLKTFADQAVVAIENARLFNETKEALEQQTATSEILRVISRSQTDVQAVFDTIAANALRLCDGRFSTVFRFDGALIHIAAFRNLTAEGTAAFHSAYPCPPSRGGNTQRAILTRSVVHMPDVLKDPEYVYQEAAKRASFRSALSVPMLLDGQSIGAISVFRAAATPFPDSQIELLKTFAEQAVIAIENVRLFTELEVRTKDLTRSVRELKALGDVGQAVSSTLDLATVLATIVARATALGGMDAGAIYEYDELHEKFYLRTADRLPDEIVAALRAEPVQKGEGALGRMATSVEPAQIPDIMTDASYRSRIREALIRLGYRSLMAVPLLREDHLLGGLVVYRVDAGAFAQPVIDLLKTFAAQSALAIQNARLFREIEDKGRQLQVASHHKSEFLANMSHELRTPLNAIIGFSEVLSERLFGEINEKQAEYIADILESGRHLLSLINDILDLSKIEAGRMELESTEFELPSAIENALTLVKERAHRRGIALVHTVDDRLGLIRADERKVKQVLLNLLSNALKFTPEGGRIDVKAAICDGTVQISVTDTGVGIAPEDQMAVFEEFRQVGTASKKVEGTGLGLAISRKFVELHGGRIGVKSQVGTGSTFTFSLPVTIDRRHKGPLADLPVHQ